MNRRGILKSGLIWLAVGHARAWNDEAPQGGEGGEVIEAMVHIPAGEFVMGSRFTEAGGRGGPGRGSRPDSRQDTRHIVRLSDFHIGRNLVTNAEYKAFCDAAGARYRPGGDRRAGGGSYWDHPDFDWAEKANHPVLWVGYNQAMDYCGWMSARTGANVTLPSEAQWERAARGVTRTGEEFEYPWGNATGPEDYKDHLNYNVLCAVKSGTSRNVGGKLYPYWPFVVETRPGSATASNFKAVVYGEEDGRTPDIQESSDEVKAVWRKVMSRGGCTTAVGSYPAGPSGCFDMAGNAFEWTRDFSSISSYLRLAEKTIDPCMDDASALTAEDRRSGSDGTFGSPGSGSEGRPTKVIRGGSWYASEGSCRTHRRLETRAAGNVGYHSVGFRVVATSKRRTA